LPHPLHSAQLLLQLLRIPDSGPERGGDADSVEPVACDDDSSLNDTLRVTDAGSHRVLVTVADSVRQWALQHAYSSQWIQLFQSSN